MKIYFMNRPIYAIIAFICLLLPAAVHAQETPKEKADKLMREAIELMDNHQEDQAIKLLKEARIQNPADSFTYDYEMGYASYVKKDYKGTIDIYGRLCRNPKVTDQVYMMLGNAYDDSGNEPMALKTYADGLKKFPNSGKREAVSDAVGS